MHAHPKLVYFSVLKWSNLNDRGLGMTYKIVKKMSSEQILGRNLNEAMGHVNHLKIKEKNTFKLQLVSPAKCAGETGEKLVEVFNQWLVQLDAYAKRGSSPHQQKIMF